MKKLGMGMMRLPLLDPENTSSVDREAVCRMVDAFLENGFSYFDTAYVYHNYQSEIVVREALVKRHPRESFVLANKLPTMCLKAEGDQERIFEEQLEKCGVEYFDYYLIHTLHKKYYEIATKFDSFGFLSRLKKEGKIRKMGFSFHDSAEVLEQILREHPEVDFVQIQLNYLDWDHESIQSRACYEVCRRYGKPIVVMEPIKGGTLASVPDRIREKFFALRPHASVASWAIRFAASMEGVFMVLSGMSDMAQLEDNMSYMREFEPMSEAELALLPEAVKAICEDVAVACTGCRYCVEGCPKNIEIPKYFALYNAEKQALNQLFSVQQAYYENYTRLYGKASDCIGCRKCERACPQHIRIVDALRQVAKTFED